MNDRRRLSWYLVPVVVAPVLVFALALVLIPSQWFALRSQNRYLMNLGYGEGLRGQDCQVVVYGDSSAMVGVDPKIVAAKTGLSTCNIAEFLGVTTASGTAPLDRYLGKNKKPQVIAFLYAPENFSRAKQWPKAGMFEAITYKVRFEKNASTAEMLAEHPESTMLWAEQGIRMMVPRLFSKPAWAETGVRGQDLGQFKIFGNALRTCSGEGRFVPPDPAWVAGLKSKYGADGTRVIFDVTPVLSCDPARDFYDEGLKGLANNWPVPVYPTEDFLDESGTRMHMNETGSAKISEYLAGQLVAKDGGR